MKILILLCSLSLYGGAALAQSLNVVSTYPADGAFAVETDSIVITFDQKVNFDPFFMEDSDFNFLIAPEDSAQQLGAALSDDSLSVIFYGTLAPNTDYVALLEYAVGINGEILQTPYLFSFTTYPAIGEFVVEGYLTQDVLQKELLNQVGNDIIVYLSNDPFKIRISDDECMDEDCGGDPEPIYAAFANMSTGFYSIPGVREGTYFPLAFSASFDPMGSEYIFPELYIYDPDTNFEPNSIDVNSTSAPSNTLSGIDLRKVELIPITFAEALVIAQGELNNLPNSPTVMGGGTFYAYFNFIDQNSEPVFKSSILKKITQPITSKMKSVEGVSSNIFDILSSADGYQIEWSIYGYDAVKDSAFEIISTPFGAEFIAYFGVVEAELPEGVEFSSIKALPENFIDSDSAATIFEAAGGAAFREMFGGEFGFWNMDMEAIHRYWDYPNNLTIEAPVMWFGEYYGYTFNPNTNEYLEGYLIVILDVETGEILYTDTQTGGFGETSNINFDEALDLAVPFINQLPNNPIIVGGATYYNSYDAFFNKIAKKAPKEFLTKVKAITEVVQNTVQPDGYASNWEIYAYDAVKDSALAVYVTKFDVELAGYMGGESDNGVPFELGQIKPLPESYISSDSAATLIDAAGGLAFRSTRAKPALNWEWDMELQLLHQYWDYPPNPTPTAPVTWSGKYFAWAFDGETNEYLEDSLSIYLDATTGEVLYSNVIVSNDIEPDLPEKFSLSQNYPNPFNPSTNIQFQLSTASQVEISIYSILGQKVATIVNDLYSPGSYSIQWNAQNLASGMYIYRMQADGFTQTRKLMLLK